MFNRCAKINRTASPNSLIIGEDFYNIAKTIDEFIFEKINTDDVSNEHEYVGYIVKRKN